MNNSITLKMLLLPVAEIVRRFSRGTLESPAFQRNAIYTDRDALKLIASIKNGIRTPLTFWNDPNKPNVSFLLDGLQRTTALARFLGLHPTMPRLYNNHHDYHRLTETQKREFNNIQIPVVLYVTSDDAFARDLFIQMNTTQHAMNTPEVRHSKFYDTDFMAAVHALTERHKSFFTGQGIVAPQQYARRRGEEIIAQLLSCIYLQVVAGLNEIQFVANSRDVDKVIEAFVKNPDMGALKESMNMFSGLVAGMDRYFPTLYRTQFTNLSSFRALFLVVLQYRQKGYGTTPSAMDAMLEASKHLAQDVEFLELTKGGANNSNKLRDIFNRIGTALKPAFARPTETVLVFSY